MATSIILHQPVSEKVIRHSLDNSLPAIQLLQQKLTAKEFFFHQNVKIQNYSFDFYNPSYKIAIDIDGYAHEFSEVFSNDASKKLYINSLGIVVFKFTDYQILTDIEEIVRAIKNQIKSLTTSHAV